LTVFSFNVHADPDPGSAQEKMDPNPSHISSIFGNLVISDFWTPPPLPPMNFVHQSYMKDMDIIDHVAAAPCPHGLS